MEQLNRWISEFKEDILRDKQTKQKMKVSHKRQNMGLIPKEG